ncbi:MULTISPECIES: sensor histidine kinase [unclassified Lentimicrobium]|uniref:sensor histidine kinase n=1 Tax=unclassified Lentimicrobium TaxID=2677434 RepID=UPI0015538B30|nr:MULTISPECIES: histidine kinase [unclassified Lentimicrobium]NPD44674.1 histidine kinase [Lentimicrobium sp. S6]NPD85854.1 histidine kinase [Lentimicrobium sp. L6]
MTIRNRLTYIFSSITTYHIIFWLANFILLTSPFFLEYNQKGVFKIEKLYSGLIYFFHLILIVYINYSILIPKYEVKRKTTWYFLSVTTSVIIVNLLFIGTFNFVMNAALSLRSGIWFFILEIIYIIITSFFKFFKEWINKQSLELNIIEIQKQKTEAELDALKAQLNPHFLFNVLNSIYSHSLLKSDITPTIVLKLSSLISYILYDCKTELVPLNKEIDFIKDYIELEQIRMEKDIDVKIEISNMEHTMIPPLLFVPLIENVFKHGIGSEPKKKCLSLTINSLKGEFHFSLKNSKGKVEKIHKSDKSGIGIINVKKRLQLLYPNKHNIIINDKDDTFEVEISINGLGLNK